MLDEMQFRFRYYRTPNPAADAAAEHLVEALERSGIVVMRKAPAPAHTGHVPAHGVKLGRGTI